MTESDHQAFVAGATAAMTGGANPHEMPSDRSGEWNQWECGHALIRRLLPQCRDQLVGVAFRDGMHAYFCGAPSTANPHKLTEGKGILWADWNGGWHYARAHYHGLVERADAGRALAEKVAVAVGDGTGVLRLYGLPEALAEWREAVQ